MELIENLFVGGNVTDLETIVYSLRREVPVLRLYCIVYFEDKNRLSWGAMGEIWGAPSFHCVVRTNRYTLQYLDRNELFSACFFDPGYKPALQFCGTHSGRDCDKAKQTGLRPVLLDGTTAFAQARRVLICRKRYTAMMQPEGFIEPETYERWYGTDPMHREFVGEVLAYYEKLH